MYLEHWGLKEMPFENTPDPRFFYHSGQHEEGLSRIRYVVERRKGACMLTGVYGCGKTVLVKTLCSELRHQNYQIAFIANPQLRAVELLRSIARYLGGENLPHKFTDMSSDYFLEVIESILINNVKDGRQTVVVIDEGHVITDLSVLEELRLLLNFQLEDRFLLTLILMGQPELSERVKKTKQLLQRISLSYHIGPLPEGEIAGYIKHRFEVAGREDSVFSDDAIKIIHRMAGGIPRRINQICDLSLLVGASSNSDRIELETVEEAISSFEVG